MAMAFSLQALATAQALWAGRDGAPYFQRVRCRPALDVAAGADSAEPQQQAASSTAAVAAASEVLRELLGQNWRVELDAGLGGALGGPDSEALLLVCAPQAVAQLLAAVADVAGPAGAGQEPLPSGAV